MPTFSDWLRALRLFLASYCGGILFMFVFWINLLIGFFASIASLNSMPLLLWVFALAIIALGFLGFALGEQMVAYFFTETFRYKPDFLNPEVTTKRCAHDYAIATWATLPMAIIWFIRFTANTQLNSLKSIGFSDVAALLAESMLPYEIVNYFWLWFIITAFICSYQRRKQP